MNEIFGENNFELKNKISKDAAEKDVDYCYEHAAGTTIICRVPDELQNDLKIVTEVRNNRTIKKMSPGWTDTVFKIVTKQLNSKCVFNFEKANLFQTENSTEFETKAKCAECDGTLHIVSSYDRKEMQLNFEPGTGTHSHTKFRRVTATRAKLLYKNLENHSVNNVYLQQAESLADDADHLPADFVSQKSLENIKTNHSSSNDSAINELRKMKYSVEYDQSIKELQTDPFVVMFWTKQQIHLYAQKSAEYRYIGISVDATGSVVTNKSLLTDISDSLDREVTLPHVFLYLISVKCLDKSIPVGQVLSAQQDSTRISYFFDRWMEDFKKPSEVVIDDSKAFLKSCANTFASCKSIKEYNEICFEE